MTSMLIFGLGYASGHIAQRLLERDWKVGSTRRAADGTSMAFDDAASVRHAIGTATHILSSVPPDAAGRDPVIDAYGPDIAASPARWIGYLSSTGVYGDAGGAWVDEHGPLGGRRTARIAADLAWRELSAAVCRFRLPGIYGPGRSALERVREGRAHRIDLPGQVFSRVHVDDIVSGVIASFDGPPGIYNLADDLPCSQNRVIEAACDLLGCDWPPLQSVVNATLTPAARAFYAENRRIANGRAKRLLGWKPLHPTYREGLTACFNG